METLYQGGVLLCANGDSTHYIMVTKPHLGTAYNELCIPGHILATKASKRALRGVVFVSTQSACQASPPPSHHQFVCTPILRCSDMLALVEINFGSAKPKPGQP